MFDTPYYTLILTINEARCLDKPEKQTMKTKTQKVRDTKSGRKEVLRRRHNEAIKRSSARWDGVHKILGLVARSGAVVCSVPAVHLAAAKYVL
jgi:hypothetical protein